MSDFFKLNSMKTPFTTEQFFEVFKNYNSGIFPTQIFLFFLGLLLFFLVTSKIKRKNNYIGVILGLLWIWTGLVYHIIYFTEINKVALVFGSMFILEGIFILIETFRKNCFEFTFKKGTDGYTGYFIMFFGLILYPLIGYLTEGDPKTVISLGLPCPSTIFTFGLFILSSSSLKKYLLIIPVLWSLIGLSAAINFGVYQDFMLIISAIVTLILVFRKR